MVGCGCFLLGVFLFLFGIKVFVVLVVDMEIRYCGLFFVEVWLFNLGKLELGERGVV